MKAAFRADIGINAVARAGSSGAPDVRLSIYEDLSTVAHEWCAFEHRADCTAFQLFGWLSTWHIHVGARKAVRPAIVIGRNSKGEILFLLPLSVEPAGFACRLTWLGSESNDYNGPLLAPEFSQELGLSRFLSLWPEIIKRIQCNPYLRFDLIHFVRMPAVVGVQQNPFCYLSVTTHPSGVYFTRLSEDWETLYATKRSSSTRQRDRTKRNRLSDLGEIKIVTPTADGEITDCFDTLIAQKTHSFAAMGIANIFDRPGYPEFFRSLATGPATRHLVHVSRLDVGAVPAAVNLGLIFRGRYYHLLASYDHGEVSRFGPGAVHLHELMRYAMGVGCIVFDFTVGDEPYKRDWSDTETELFDYVGTARWRGAFLTLPLLGMIRMKRFIKQTPRLWMTFRKARALIGRLRRIERKSPNAGEQS